MKSFIQQLTGLMSNLADPNKKVEDTMMSFMSFIVKSMIKVIGNLFKPVLGEAAEPVINAFSEEASKAFNRFAAESYSGKSPTYMPSFDLIQRTTAQLAREAAAPASSASPSSSRARSLSR